MFERERLVLLPLSYWLLLLFTPLESIQFVVNSEIGMCVSRYI